jgi:hypothetical protein
MADHDKKRKQNDVRVVLPLAENVQLSSLTRQALTERFSPLYKGELEGVLRPATLLPTAYLLPKAAHSLQRGS